MAQTDFNVKITIDTRKLDKFVDNLGNEVWDVMKVAAFKIESHSKRIVPVDTGATKNSIRQYEHRGDMAIRIGPGTHYAPFLEFGTRFMRARPFMIPALEANRFAFVNAMKMLLQRG